MKSNIEVLLTEVFDIMDNVFQDGYVIMNKYDEVPYKLPSDLDICIYQKDFDRLDEIITHISKKTGLLITQKIWHHYRKCAYILSPSEIDFPFRLQLDFFTDFSVKRTPLLIPADEILNNTRIYNRFTIPDYHIEYVFLLMRRIFKNDFNEAHCTTIHEIVSSTDSEKVKDYSRKYFGVYSDAIYEAIQKQDLFYLQSGRNDFFYQIINLSKKKSSGSYKFKYNINELLRAFYRIRYPVGMSIALLSPDGGGKSSVLLKIKDLCWGSFHGVERRYFRPRLLKNIGSYKLINTVGESSDNPDPHNVQLNNPIKSVIRFLFYNVDFIVGYYVKIKPSTIKKQLNIFDRYYHDYYADMHRYSYRLPEWFPNLFEWMIPKPDITFILDGTAEVFFHRKQELNMKELERQIQAYRKLHKKITNSYLIDANGQIDVVSQKIASIILKVKAKQTAKAMGNKLNKQFIPI